MSLGELQASVDNFSAWKAILWCFYPIATLVLLELLLRQIDDDDDLQLPEWATAPSANREEIETELESNDVNQIEISDKFEVEVLDSNSESVGSFQETNSVELTDEIIEVEKAPMQPTVNYREKSKRRLSVPQKPDILQLEKESMHYAATNSKPFDGELEDLGFDAIDSAVTALNSKKDEFRDVGDWITSEERDWKVLETRGMGAAVQNSRPVRHKVKNVESSSISRLHVRQWGAAADSAAQANARGITPEDTDNPNARESASRAQHVKTLTQLLVGSELDALYSDREQMVSSSGIKLDILERISALGDKGHPIRNLVERIEANSKEGLIMLEDLEKKSLLVDDLIKRLNIQEDRSVIEPKVASRYREQLVLFKRIDEVKSLIKDFEG